MQDNNKPLTESVIRRLTNSALCSFLGEADDFESAARPGIQLALSNEPIADMNMLVLGKGVKSEDFRQMAGACLEKQLPFLAMIFPEAGENMDKIAAELGLVYAVNFPLMVRDDIPLDVSGNPEVKVSSAASAGDIEGSAEVLVSAYNMMKDSVLRCLPPSLLESPNIDIYIAQIQDDILGSVTLTYHGDTCGIWAMGTNSARQHSGIGERLLSSAMAHARSKGTRRFFLGATPAGKRLYEKLDFTTVCEARVWVSGETHQA